MSVFERLVLWQCRAGQCSLGQARSMIRLLRSYSRAFGNGAYSLPKLPVRYARKPGFRIVWVLCRLSLKEPVIFALGLVCLVPAVLYSFYTIVA